MKKVNLFLAAIFCAVSILAGPLTAQEKNETYTVGMILSLSGIAADYGEAIRNGVELARQDRPELFTHVRFMYEDAGYEPTRAVTAFKKFADIDKVDLVHSFGAIFCQAIAPSAKVKGVLYAAECVDPSIGVDAPRTFRILNSADEYMQAQVAYLKKHSFKKIALLISDNGYLQTMSEAFKRSLTPEISSTIIDRVPVAERDLRSAIVRIRGGHYDAVGVFLAVGQISAFYRQAKEQHLELPTFGTNWFESIAEIEAAGGAMQGAVFANNPVKKVWFKRYLQQFHSPAAITYVAPAYEFALLIGEIVSNSKKKPMADEFISKLAGLGVREGVAIGPYRFVNDPQQGQYLKFPIVMKRISGDGFEEY